MIQGPGSFRVRSALRKVFRLHSWHIYGLRLQYWPKTFQVCLPEREHDVRRRIGLTLEAMSKSRRWHQPVGPGLTHETA